MGENQVHRHAADGRPYGAGAGSVIALLVGRHEHEEGVHGEPVGPGDIGQIADCIADGHDHGQAQGKPHLKGLQGAALPQGDDQLLHAGLVAAEIGGPGLRHLLQDEHHHVEE